MASESWVGFEPFTLESWRPDLKMMKVGGLEGGYISYHE